MIFCNNFNIFKLSLIYLCHIFLIQFTFAQNISSNFIPGNTGIRIRLNEPLFHEAANIFQSLFSYRVQTVQIPQQQQCFPEGCFSLFNFRVTSFSQPRSITLKPLSPNYLFLNILMFDLDIVGTVSGNLQIVLSVPIGGGIVIIAKALSISATLDLQKNQFRQPYLRVSACELRAGYIDAKVTDLGLLTDSINFKYKQEMIGKAREVIQSTICSNLELIVKTQVNTKLAEIPKAVAVSDVLDYLDKDKEIPEKVRTRPRRWKRENREFQRIQRRGIAKIEEITPNISTPRKKEPSPPPPQSNDEDYDIWGHSSSTDNTSEKPAPPPSPSHQQQNLRVKHIPAPVQPRPTPPVSRRELRVEHVPSSNIQSLPQEDASLSKLIKLVDINNFQKLFIDMDFIDSIAGEDYFSVGVDGLGFVSSSKSPTIVSTIQSSDIIPRKLRFPGRIQRRNLDIVLSDFTPNSLLIQAHRAKLLSIKITGETPMFGKLLRTNCSPDEICLSDTVSEAAELYPNRQLGAYIETLRPPKFSIKQGKLKSF
uniref:Lipid-binding serum glycoprotein N-terminal domain-containing protein n=1 Tax=Panagrolaimus sp. PS1159 TaxID=55785 RepID=A0AC35FP09_9BILA